MKSILGAIAITLVGAGTAFAADMAGAQQTVTDRESQWAQALIHGDVKALRNIIAEDWMGQDDSGKVADRKMILHNIKTGASTVSSMNNHDLNVRVFGDMAIVQGSDTERSTYKGKDTSGEYTWMDIWQNRGGQWVVIASQNTKVSPQK